MPEAYEAGSYWSQRLGDDFSLRGVGHHGFSEEYNRWLYRAKRDALDIGSGVGWVVEQLLGHGLKVDGCDIADVAVERLSARYPESHFFQAAIGSVPLPIDDGAYDLVTMLDVAYHITDDALFAEAVREVARMLRPGGRFIVTDRLDKRPFSTAPHVKFRSRAQWDAATGSAGLAFTRVEVLFRWLSREHELRGWKRLPHHLRGRIEYTLDRTGVGRPNLRWAVLVKQ